MKDFKKGGFGAPRSGGFRKEGGFGGKPSFGGRPDYKKKTWDKPKDFGGDRQMFDATCSGCGKSCQVPFRPSGGKEVFCNDCFGKTKGDESFVRNDARGGYEDRAPRGMSGGQNIDAVVRQLQVVASKLDQLIVIMNATAKASKPASEKTTAPAVAATAKPVTAASVAPATEKPVTAKKVAVAKKAAPAKKVAAKKAVSKKK